MLGLAKASSLCSVCVCESFQLKTEASYSLFPICATLFCTCKSTRELHANGQHVAVLYLRRFDRIGGEGLGGRSWSSHQQLRLVPGLTGRGRMLLALLLTCFPPQQTWLTEATEANITCTRQEPPSQTRRALGCPQRSHAAASR